MKQNYKVFYCNRAESVEVASFPSLEEAIAYCESEVSGKEEFTGDEHDLISECHYEVYDDLGIEEATPNYVTNLYWED